MRFPKLMAAMILVPTSVGLVALPGCSTAPATQAQTEDLNATAMSRLQVIEHDNSSVADLVKNSYAYAMIPEVGKGGAGISAGGGKGVVYENGKYWGTCQTQFVDGGLTLGAETYTELVVFQTKDAFNSFIGSGVKFDSAASATAIQAGVTVKPKYENGSALLTYNTKGLMFDASVGAQQFTTLPAITKTGPAPAMPTTGPAM
jgi:lipid-binding SYLF domain-containing protein